MKINPIQQNQNVNFQGRINSGLQRVTNTIPKTGTHIIKFFNEDKLMSKVVIPGPRNSNPYRIEKMITNYENGQPKKIVLKFRDYTDAILHHDATRHNNSKFKQVL